ncbi:calcium-activated potassium channel subunit beta-2 [Gadus morhua]|uniref:Potassium large conductance calcium-activated channel, subfamily M, beta member 2a n=3 Tax=Gadus TaxID=8048 RepID=A0A8C5A3N2_GADMO|nr:calcium-activated potassium channel subunit beta-2-like [Gadus morhua]XP_059915923.1 calcium-activated potassium channel subunit beta-2-like isoform X2 [Gadus macrocephalus]
MFFVAGSKRSGGAARGNEKSMYQKFRDVDILDKKKTVTALKPGEDRAILLGLGMIISSVMMYFVLGVTILRSYADSVWTEEGVCVVLNSTIAADVNCSYHCGPDCWRVSRYPCLQIYVSINNTGRVSRLSHNEETHDASSECFFVPKCQKEMGVMQAMVVNISERLKANQQISCYYNPSERQHDTVLLSRLYGNTAVFHSLFWPSCMLTGGTLIIIMVKLNQYLSMLCEELGKVHK